MLKILVCDDDEQTVKNVTDCLAEFSRDINLEFNISSSYNANELIKNDCCFDIAIIDIEMPGIDGLKLSEILKAENPDVIILILTSFLKYLDDAMRVEVFRYLQKPPDKKRLFKNMTDAICKYRDLSKNIVVRLNDGIHYINTRDILYIEIIKNGSNIITKNGFYKTNKKPGEWVTAFNSPGKFAFCHKSYCVNLQNVISISRKEVELRKNPNETIKLSISQSRYRTFREAFLIYAGGAI